MKDTQSKSISPQQKRARGSRVDPSSPQASATMRANRRRDTGPELQIRSLLHGMGFRFRVDFPIKVAGLTARPDLVFTVPKVAVFVDGCFWHACPIHSEIPKANQKFWEEKLRRTAERDHRQTKALASAGWEAIRVWEHEEPAAAALDIAVRIRKRREGPGD